MGKPCQDPTSPTPGAVPAPAGQHSRSDVELFSSWEEPTHSRLDSCPASREVETGCWVLRYREDPAVLEWSEWKKIWTVFSMQHVHSELLHEVRTVEFIHTNRQWCNGSWLRGAGFALRAGFHRAQLYVQINCCKWKCYPACLLSQKMGMIPLWKVSWIMSYFLSILRIQIIGVSFLTNL